MHSQRTSPVVKYAREMYSGVVGIKKNQYDSVCFVIDFWIFEYDSLRVDSRAKAWSGRGLSALFVRIVKIII